MHVASAGPTTVALDEFPFLAKASPALPSIIQRALDPTAQHTNTPVRLLLCGSALSFTGNLLSGNAPLRGRAGLELIVPTLDYRLAAEFWGITDPHTAALTHAILGGTPAYRRDHPRRHPRRSRRLRPLGHPRRAQPRPAPVPRGPLPAGREPDLRDAALYHSVLAAIADGNHTRGGIAGHPALVASGTVNDPTHRTTHDIDAAVLGDPGNGRRTALSIGEAKRRSAVRAGRRTLDATRTASRCASWAGRGCRRRAGRAPPRGHAPQWR
jgi:hypothetical protein